MPRTVSPSRSIPRHRCTGSVLVTTAIALTTIVICLIGVELGFLSYQKRELQKSVDLAALAGAQVVEPTVCTAARSGAKRTANGGGTNDSGRNLPSTYTLQDDQIQCGRWDHTFASEDHFDGISSEENNSVRVAIQVDAPTLFPFFTGSRAISVKAVAMREEPLAVFSVGTTLVNVGCNQQLAPLVQLLKIVGAGNPCVTVGGYGGLVGAQVSASGLLKELGAPLDANLSIGDVNNLLSAKKVSLGFLLETALTLGGHAELLGLNANLLNLIGTQLGIDALHLEIPLGSGPNGPGIFAGIHAPDGTKASALDVQVNVLDIVTAAVGIGTSGRGISIPGLELSIPGVLPNLLKVKAGVIEPPSIAIGGVGATAYNAQVRLYADVDTGGGLLGGLLQLLGTRIKLPIFIDLARAKGTIEELTCRAPVKDSTAVIRVDASIANACIGKVTGDPFSKRTPICESLQKETLISVLGLVKIDNKVAVEVLSPTPSPYRSPPMKAGDVWQTPGNDLPLGTTLQKLLEELLRVVGELLGSPTKANWTPAENEASANTLANYYLGLSTPPHLAGPLPKRHLGLLGPPGAYDIDILKNRLKADINRTSQSCFLLPFLCWQTNEWDTWANDIESANIASGRACWGSTAEGSVTAGLLGTAGDVTRFNKCVERELKEAMLQEPASNKPNFLQVLLNPLLDVLAKILNPLGSLLAGPVLKDLLGIQLGLNDVEVTSVGCGNAKLVY